MVRLSVRHPVDSAGCRTDDFICGFILAPWAGCDGGVGDTGMLSNYKTRLDELESSAPGAYQKSGAVLDAQKALSDYEGKKPGAYTSRYQDQLDGLLDKLSNRKFDYDFNKDALYQQYKDKYTEQGRQAAVNAAASASALTGGYGNSYAASAAAQANQQYMTELNDRIPELYQLAMARYQNEGNDLTSLYGLYQGADATDYGRYQDSVTDFYNYLNYLTQKENTAYSRDYTEWGDRVNRYNTDRDYLYTGYRGDVADEQWAKELAEQQRQYDATMAENRRQFDANLALSREELAYKQAAAAAAKTASTGTSKGYPAERCHEVVQLPRRERDQHEGGNRRSLWREGQEILPDADAGHQRGERCTEPDGLRPADQNHGAQLEGCQGGREPARGNPAADGVHPRCSGDKPEIPDGSAGLRRGQAEAGHGAGREQLRHCQVEKLGLL